MKGTIYKNKNGEAFEILGAGIDATKTGTGEEYLFYVASSGQIGGVITFGSLANFSDWRKMVARASSF